MSWHSLPAELKLEIVRHFELPRLELGARLPSQEFLANRSVLRNLCLTGRSADAVARPWLYRSIILFTDFKELDESSGNGSNAPLDDAKLPESDHPLVGTYTMVRLLRTLTHHPPLRLHIKYMACPLSVSGLPNDRFPGIQLDRYTQPISATWKSHAHEFSDTSGVERKVLNIAGLHTPPLDSGEGSDEIIAHDLRKREYARVPQKLLGALLCLLPEVNAVLLEEHHFWPCKVVNMILWECLRNHATVWTVLPKLATLQLQVQEIPRGLSSVSFDTVGALLKLPTLRHIETLRDDGFQSLFQVNSSASHIEGVNLPTWMSQIETLDLSSVNYHCAYFYAACEMATSLRRLSLDATRMHDGHSRSSYVSPHSEATLDTALLLRAETLEELRLASFELHSYLHIGSSSLLTCLPSMVKLRVLSIDNCSLFGPAQQIEHLSLPDLLPPNLERLDLCDCFPKMERDFSFDNFMLTGQESYFDASVRQFKQLAEAVGPPE
ncbi:hypothetical protein PG994_000826 [Apiospora phragmitis]|uniref:F-box domain-containing protein n=1 Tax=Apiospora phragmitis TaxID=2905665 RepID=A0ABR1X7E4_9PEZI